MEFTRDQIKITKGVAILFMMLLHLFCTKNYEGLYTPLIFIGNTPLMYYLALFGDCCVAIYCFCSGYGLILGYKKDEKSYFKSDDVSSDGIGRSYNECTYKFERSKSS